MSGILTALLRLLELVFGTHRPSAAPTAPAPAPLSPPADKSFSDAMAFIMQPQNDGQRDDRAPGETFNTQWGITDDTWTLAVKKGIVVGDITNMTLDQRNAIYRMEYWNPMGCPALNPGVAMVLFNDAVLTGVGHVARLLQRAVGAAEDGVVGPVTVAAANTRVPQDLIRQLIAADEAYLATLASAPKFLRGWTRREDDCRAAALAVA